MDLCQLQLVYALILSEVLSRKCVPELALLRHIRLSGLNPSRCDFAIHERGTRLPCGTLTVSDWSHSILIHVEVKFPAHDRPDDQPKPRRMHDGLQHRLHLDLSPLPHPIRVDCHGSCQRSRSRFRLFCATGSRNRSPLPVHHFLVLVGGSLCHDEAGLRAR